MKIAPEWKPREWFVTALHWAVTRHGLSPGKVVPSSLFREEQPRSCQHPTLPEPEECGFPSWRVNPLVSHCACHWCPRKREVENWTSSTLQYYSLSIELSKVCEHQGHSPPLWELRWMDHWPLVHLALSNLSRRLPSVHTSWATTFIC